MDFNNIKGLITNYEEGNFKKLMTNKENIYH
jgi:hypothetical protein